MESFSKEKVLAARFTTSTLVSLLARSTLFIAYFETIKSKKLNNFETCKDDVCHISAESTVSVILVSTGLERHVFLAEESKSSLKSRSSTIARSRGGWTGGRL